MTTNKEKWLAWVARNPIQLYMDRAKISTQAVAAILLVSRQIVYRWLDGQTIPNPRRISQLEEHEIASATDYAAWWAEHPNPPARRSKSGIDRERIRQLIVEKSQYDPATQCQVFCGCWDKDGKAMVRIGRRTYSVQMAALWVAGKVELFDRVYAYRTCRSPACCNLKHIKIAGDVAEGLKAMRKKGIIGPPRKRGLYLTERRRETVKILLEEGRTPEQIAEDTGVGIHLIRRVAN